MAQSGDRVDAGFDQPHGCAICGSAADQIKAGGQTGGQAGKVAFGNIGAQFQRAVADQGEHRLARGRSDGAKLGVAGDNLARKRGFHIGARQLQQADFVGILKAMSGYPVTVRLLDPPLHEFLPDLATLSAEMATAEALNSTITPRDKAIFAAVKRLHEANPMLGLRGVRLGILIPELFKMQVRALVLASLAVKKEGFDSEQASEMIHKEIEEATSLEMPMLEKHMTILSTLVSLGTLAGLLGTVTGMIKAFGALASAGTPDQAMLANGISEALINTATGISTSALAIIMYNLFTSKIDTLTYSIDEAGTAIVNTYRRYRGSLK